MSYDILAFDPSATDDADFLSWWDGQAAWSEDHTYADPAVTTPALRAFYEELTLTFPNMNEADEDELDADEDGESLLSEYSIGRHLVYACFAWSQAAHAREVFGAPAAKHGVAVGWVSDDASVSRP